MNSKVDEQLSLRSLLVSTYIDKLYLVDAFDLSRVQGVREVKFIVTDLAKKDDSIFVYFISDALIVRMSYSRTINFNRTFISKKV